MKKIKLGYEIRTGKEVNITPSHLIVTGVSQQSGKTTTLESLINRSGLKAIVFRTKIGEKSFLKGTIIPPFFKDRSDWQFIQGLVEATIKEKLRTFERAKIIQIAKKTGGKSLLEFKKKVDERLLEKINSFETDILTNLQAYLEIVLPKLQSITFSNELELVEGVNIIDLERFSRDLEVQSLIIRSVADEILNKFKNVILVIPECLRGDSLVLMDNGTVKRIKEIKNNEKVFGGKVTNRFTKQTSRLLRFSGSFDLETTISHPCFVLEKGMFSHKRKYRAVGCQINEDDIKVKLAKDVQVGDYFLIPATKIPHTVKYNWTPEQLGFIAMVLTDGNIRRGKNCGLVRVSVSKDVRWYKKKFKEGLKAFGFEDTFKKKKTSRKETVFWSNSKELVDILWSFGCFGGKKSAKIDIVSQVFLSPLKSIAKFINICFCCDGNVSVGGFPRFGSTSEVFVKKLQYLLLKFGINSNIRKQKGERYSHKYFWELVIFRESVKKFRELISFDMERKQSKIAKNILRKDKYVLFDGKKYYLRCIKKIEKIKCSDNVYDFTTKKHYFIANGVLTHNCWKFIPQKRGNPCKLIIEEYIRQGATNNNFIWIDSQDMANVDKIPLKQISTWILGYQSEINEVKHTLNQIPLPSSKKPKPDDIMSLGLGEFYLATRDATIKTYIQPFWLDDKHAKKVAMGKLKVSELDAPEMIAPFKVAIRKETRISEQPAIDFQETSKRFNKELNEMSSDFFNKISEVQEQINKLYTEIYNLKHQPKHEIDEDTVVRKVIQKMPASQNSGASFSKEEIISEVLLRVPKMSGAVTYEVAPLEKIRKDFLEEAKGKVILDIKELDDEGRKILKFVESLQKRTNISEIMEKGLYLNPSSGSRSRITKKIDSMVILEIIRKEKGHLYPNLREKAKKYMEVNEATGEEVEQVYNHILMELL